MMRKKNAWKREPTTLPLCPVGETGSSGHGLIPLAAQTDRSALAALARPVDHDLATPDHAPGDERAYAHEWG